jgi:hypothetical protein
MMLSIDQIDGRLSGLTFAEAENELGMFNSYERTPALVLVLGRAPTPADIMRVFLDWGHMCDAPWWDRTHIAMYLRRAISEINMADFLELDARAFYDALPPVVSIWRGCERGRERGLSWTTIVQSPKLLQAESAAATVPLHWRRRKSPSSTSSLCSSVEAKTKSSSIHDGYGNFKLTILAISAILK